MPLSQTHSQSSLPRQNHRLGNSGVSHGRVTEQGTSDAIHFVVGFFGKAFLLFILVLVNMAKIFRIKKISGHRLP